MIFVIQVYMKRIWIGLLCIALFSTVIAMPVSADFQVTNYNEEIYAGGILDMMAFVGETDLSGYSFRWQADASLGKGSWYDLEDNDAYKGTKTNHLQLYSTYGMDYEDFDCIPFRCAVTKNGITKYTSDMYMHIYPTEDMWKALDNKRIGLFEPNLTNVTGFHAKDELNYAANTYAGSTIEIRCGGSTESAIQLLENSNVQLKREIVITENGKTTVSGDNTSYIPYTVGSNAVKIQINMRVIMAGVDRGIYQTKTVTLHTQKPAATAVGKAKSACSLLRYTYNESEKLASIPKGERLEIVGKTGSYYQVFFSGMVGYVGSSMVEADMTDSKIIDHVELKMAEPLAGNIWPSSITVKPDSCFATSVEWYDSTSGHFMTSGERFVKGHDYQLVVWVSAKEGYSFKLDSSNQMLTTAVLNGNLPCFTSKAYEQVIGKVIDIRYDFYNVQEGQTPEPTQPSTTPTQPQHTHTPSQWRITGAYHYQVCTVCGDMLDQEDHKGGMATCTEKAICSVCGYAYMEENEQHNPDTSKWTACGGLYHAHLCIDCGAHCDTQDHIAGPAGTPDAAVVCKECGYIITPEKNHTHNLTRVAPKDATCTRPGNVEYYTCDGCSDFFTDNEGKNIITDVVIPPFGHTISDGWKYDGENHWRICTVCNEILAETQMSHEMHSDKCPTCGYGDTLSETNAEREDPTQLGGDREIEKNPIWRWDLSVILLAAGGVLVILVAAVGVLALCGFVFHKKKK